MVLPTLLNRLRIVFCRSVAQALKFAGEEIGYLSAAEGASSWPSRQESKERFPAIRFPSYRRYQRLKLGVAARK